MLLTVALAQAEQSSQSTTFAAERAKAKLNPYANDLGPDRIDVSAYPADLQNTYRTLLIDKCARCHTAARVLNSQFVEPSGSLSEQTAKIKAWTREHPELFSDPLVWQVVPRSSSASGIWETYVKRMMAKPGAGISPVEAKKIWEFLTYDSERRKTGSRAGSWAEHRKALLSEFKKKNKARYQDLYDVR